MLMPRGRKGPPQESVDSILLAISRRDDIDPETLSHYFDRLDEEWTHGAREKVLHLLRSNDASAHAAAVLILSELATDFDLEGLEDFITDPTVSDMAKLALSPVLKELGSEMADDGIIEYLNDPATAMHQMQMRLLELVGQNEMGIESILEDVIAMPVERRLAFINWLGNSNDPRAANLLVPLLENQTGKVVSAVIEALEQLGTVTIHQTIPALNYTIATSSNRQVKQQARAALGRLMMQSVPGVEEDVMSESRQLALPPHEARVSFIDGSGSQLIMLAWQRPDGMLKGINILYQDQWGIKDCYGIHEMDKERWDELAASLDERGFGSFLVPFAHGRALAIEARALNKRTRRKLPIAYSIWRPLIEAEDDKVAAAAATMQEPYPLDEKVLSLAQRGDELYKMSEFMSWMYEPTSRIEPYISRYWAANGASGSSGRRSRSRKGKQKDGLHELLMDQLVNEALTELIDDRWRLLYEARLRRQAALFRFVKREEDANLLGVVAALLHPDSGIAIHEQAFPRAMMRMSIEQGPLLMMVESLEMGNLGPTPLNIFDGKDR
ncbi:HEAT repeat domain-containing protein [Ktedonosporobacter rubrisoli]|uniref:HEAT repeat domain-containing protein n=2 Tax=Ktedonosporobacter rubrisoli TaxID=2509675 RepID=A0A4V0Z041_KTERU|nr:HEAT repeat domain-containing protein [Ktedonosporobacter rubrisoli]